MTDHGDLIPMESLDPRAQRIVAGVVAALEGEIFVCRDARLGCVLFICATHPLTGLNCDEHSVDHVLDHHVDQQHCDVCGAEGVATTRQPYLAPAYDVDVVNTAGERSVWSGVVCASWAACAWCAAKVPA